MFEPTAYALSKMLTQLTGREVGFTLAPKSTPTSKKEYVYGVYRVVPEGLLIVKVELLVLASLGGCLLGLPKERVLELISGSPLEEMLCDAMHEVLNVTSTPLSAAHRVVLSTMHTEATYLSRQAQDLLAAPGLQTTFDVSIQGYVSGGLSVASE